MDACGSGPGRELLVDGWKAWRRGAPDMSTLVGLGASASFGVSCIAAGLPSLGWKTFFEEPAMLLGFVLVGRALEERAKLQASADMAALQVTPFKATQTGLPFRSLPGSPHMPWSWLGCNASGLLQPPGNRCT